MLTLVTGVLIAFHSDPALANAEIKLSSRLTQDEKSLVQKTLNVADDKKLNPALLSPLYQRYFKSTELKDIQNYLSGRIELIVSSHSKLWVKTSAP